jgi:hypothetical protein
LSRRATIIRGQPPPINISSCIAVPPRDDWGIVSAVQKRNVNFPAGRRAFQTHRLNAREKPKSGVK